MGSRQQPPGGSTVNIGALAILADGVRSILFATDLACTTCSAPGGTGIFAMDARSGIGEFTSVVATASGGASRTPAPTSLGIAAISRRQGAATAAGALFLAARDSVYRIELASDAAETPLRSPTGLQLVAGSGSAGGAGAGSGDGPGLKARFNFGAHQHVGMAFDDVFGRASALFVTDPENRSIRKIDLADGSVSTYARLPGAPEDIVTDAFSGSIYVSIPSQGAIYVIEPDRIPRLFANGTAAAATVSATLADGPRFANLPLIARPQSGLDATLAPEVDRIAFDPQSASIVVTSPSGSLQFLR